ncbi:MAG: protein-glutamate O-methyltransferase [Paracoccaceae bacterium]
MTKAQQSGYMGTEDCENSEITPVDFQRIAVIAHADAGITLEDSKRSLVYSRLIRRLRHLSLRNFTEYCDLVSGANGAEERAQMIAALMTHTTRFFREEHHYKFLVETVLPPLIDAARRGDRVRLWSAGCSSGEEVYSLMFCLLQLCPEVATLDIRILASDIEKNVLRKAKSGVYLAHAVQKLNPTIVETFFDPAEVSQDQRQVKEDVRRLISFRELNLNGVWPVQGLFDVVFCRNVAIYFDAKVQDRLWQSFARAIRPGGYLFIGHSERLSASVKDRFDMNAMTTYRLRKGDQSDGAVAFIQGT